MKKTLALRMGIDIDGAKQSMEIWVSYVKLPENQIEILSVRAPTDANVLIDFSWLLDGNMMAKLADLVQTEVVYRPPVDRVCPACGSKHQGSTNTCSPCRDAMARGE